MITEVTLAGGITHWHFGNADSARHHFTNLWQDGIVPEPIRYREL